MTALAIAVAGGVAAALAFLVRRRRRLAALVGLAGFAGILAFGLAPLPYVAIAFGDARLLDSAMLRLWATAAAAALGLLALASRLLGSSGERADRGLAPAALATIAAVVLALAIDHAPAASLAVAASGFLGLAALGDVGLPDAVGGTRVIALAVVALLLAVLLLRAALIGPLLLDPVFVRSAGLALAALAVGARFWLVPLHGPFARLTRAASPALVPLAGTWLPGGFALVVLAWSASESAVLGEAPAEIRLAISAVAALSVLYAGVAALVLQDLGRLLGAVAIQQGALIVLALAGPLGGPSVPRTWIVISSLGISALAGVALGIVRLNGERAIDRLHGWARRAPLAAISLVLALTWAFGWPGLFGFETRRVLVEQVAEPPWSTVLLVAGFLPLLAWLRLLVVGVIAAPIGWAPPTWLSRRFPLAPAAAAPSRAADGSPRPFPVRAVSPLLVADPRRPWTWRIRWAWLGTLAILALALLPLAIGLGYAEVFRASGEPSPLELPTIRP